LPVSVVASTSMIAKCVFGNRFATFATASACAKPTLMTRS
jgi:hypothetical protein